jgi:hypothetical protein
VKNLSAAARAKYVEVGSGGSWPDDRAAEATQGTHALWETEPARIKKAFFQDNLEEGSVDESGLARCF